MQKLQKLWNVIEQQLQDVLQLMNCELSKNDQLTMLYDSHKTNIEGYGSQKLK